MKDIVRNTFIEPFSSPDRARTFIASIIGTFGFAASFIYLAFDIANSEPWTIMAFFLGRFAFAGFLFYPISCYLMDRIEHKKYFIYLIIMQILAILISFIIQNIMPESDIYKSVIIGVLMVLITSPFWLLFHSLMQKNTSDHNRGNEVAIAEIGKNIGYITGAIASGVVLQYFSGYWFILLSFGALLTSTLILASIFLKSKPETETNKSTAGMFEILRSNPLQTLNTIMKGSFDLLTTFSPPAWLKIIGLSGLGVGLVTALQLFLRIILAPFAGKLANKNHGSELKIGSSLKAIGWLPWLITHNPWVMIWSSVFWSIGLYIYYVGQTSRWYAYRSSSAIAAREFCCGIGRCLAVIITIPLLYYDITLFFITTFIFSLITIIISILESKKLKTEITDK